MKFPHFLVLGMSIIGDTLTLTTAKYMFISFATELDDGSPRRSYSPAHVSSWRNYNSNNACNKTGDHHHNQKEELLGQQWRKFVGERCSESVIMPRSSQKFTVDELYARNRSSMNALLKDEARASRLKFGGSQCRVPYDDEDDRQRKISTEELINYNNKALKEAIMAHTPKAMQNAESTQTRNVSNSHITMHSDRMHVERRQSSPESEVDSTSKRSPKHPHIHHSSSSIIQLHRPYEENASCRNSSTLQSSRMHTSSPGSRHSEDSNHDHYNQQQHHSVLKTSSRSSPLLFNHNRSYNIKTEVKDSDDTDTVTASSNAAATAAFMMMMMNRRAAAGRLENESLQDERNISPINQTVNDETSKTTSTKFPNIATRMPNDDILRELGLPKCSALNNVLPLQIPQINCEKPLNLCTSPRSSTSSPKSTTSNISAPQGTKRAASRSRSSSKSPLTVERTQPSPKHQISSTVHPTDDPDERSFYKRRKIAGRKSIDNKPSPIDLSRSNRSGDETEEGGEHLRFRAGLLGNVSHLYDGRSINTPDAVSKKTPSDTTTSFFPAPILMTPSPMVIQLLHHLLMRYNISLHRQETRHKF